MTANVSNYIEQGGEVTVIGGELRIESGAAITNGGTQASAIADITLVYTSNDPNITPDGTVTIADGSTPTVDELLEYCEELEVKVEGILAALRGAGIIASS